MTEPARIATVIDNVSRQLARWSDVAQESLLESQAALNQHAEYAERADHEAGMHVHHAKENWQAVADALSSCDAAGEQVDELLKSVADRQTALTSALASARGALATWTGELEEAHEWLGHARERLSKAVRRLERAQTAHQKAKRLHQSADEALKECLRRHGRRAVQRRSRRMCRREWQKYDAALAEKNRTSRELRMAELEKEAAEEEVAAAEARVSCCEQAVKSAQASVTAGQEGVRLVEDAEYHANLARDFQIAAAAAVTSAKTAVEAQRAEADRSLEEAGRAVEAVDQAGRNLRLADASYQSGRRYARDAERDLEERIERLREYDQPGI